MNKQISILGGGESGVGSAILAQKMGYAVFLSDAGAIPQKYKDELVENNIDFEENQHTEAKILKAQEVIKSPGIPDKAHIIQTIKSQNIPIISEIEFAGRYTTAKCICITGSNGKTTTTLLTYHILQKAGLNVGLGGNIGQSFARQVALKDFEYYVLELSSFQLDNMYDFKPYISILLNITPDHLDRYDYKLENYARSKFRITQNLDHNTHFIYCKDDPETMKLFTEYSFNCQLHPFTIEEITENGGYVNNDVMVINTPETENPFSMSTTLLALQGKHNQYNSLAAGIASRIMDIRSTKLKEALADFKNADHRLEDAGTIRGITFINDSKATNVNSVWYALESMNAPTILIIGGVDKGNDYSILNKLISKKVKAIVCMGIDNTALHAAFEGMVDIMVDTTSAEEAVKTAYKLGQPGDVVLLSPACASFDLFKNYEDRGRQFKQAVKEL